ncbi:MAG: dipeptide/oligopeptide/nickel ABC transporter ATP-binding protein [Chloroflexi bacterium]|nr:dipeptide/oligopeptide/nickel ABC transporter ATP-binding protein [Chloroflexota bacterium]
MNLSDNSTVLEVEDLRTYIYTRTSIVKAVDGISFNLKKGETLGIVGESGCGKTMTALSLLRLVPRPAGKIVTGEIRLNGSDLVQKTEEEMRAVRGRQISMILQDPQTSLNPVFNIGNQLGESLSIARKDDRKGLASRAVDALRKVNVAAPDRRLEDFPHQMSGGMKQRVVGAIAMSCEPSVIIADEPTTALDVTIQLQYLRLLKDIQAETGLSIIFITHDFGVVARMCDRVAVMYAGRIVEEGSVRDIFNNPSHPYTEALIQSVPKLEEKVERLYSIEGQPPLLSNLPNGCRFADRCPHAKEICTADYPDSFNISEGHTADCWRLDSSW